MARRLFGAKLLSAPMLPSQGTYFNDILFKIQKFSFKEMHLEMSAKWRPFSRPQCFKTKTCSRVRNFAYIIVVTEVDKQLGDFVDPTSSHGQFHQ